MLDLTGLPALDLAIGLAFIFFLLSTLAATIQELIAAIFGLRARTLEQGLRSMLEDPRRAGSTSTVLRSRTDQVALPHPAAGGRDRRRTRPKPRPPSAGSWDVQQTRQGDDKGR